jgi:hypothetical protein
MQKSSGIAESDVGRYHSVKAIGNIELNSVSSYLIAAFWIHDRISVKMPKRQALEYPDVSSLLQHLDGFLGTIWCYTTP